MMSGYKIALYGGRRDGGEATVSVDIIRSGRIDLPDQRPLAASCWDGSTPDYQIGYDLLTYRWDGTVREDGAYRFRLEEKTS